MNKNYCMYINVLDGKIRKWWLKNAYVIDLVLTFLLNIINIKLMFVQYT